MMKANCGAALAALALTLLCYPRPLLADANERAGFLERMLLGEDPAMLADAALKNGDPQRGAVAFYQNTLACARCHISHDGTPPIGPDLTHFEKPPATAELVQSILRPSHSIREGYQSIVVVQGNGVPWTGLLEEELPDRLRARDVTTGERVEFPKADLEEWSLSSESVMPSGLVNQLGTRQQFLDLVSYVHEVATGGPSRALELRPPITDAAVQPLPEYEQHIDHAGMIRGFGHDAFERGQAIYVRMCANCHGTVDREGSLPTSRRFATEPLKNGSDPYSIYQTLTRGFGLMTPQTWLVPQQKYDVVHYIREAFLRSHNPSQYFAVDTEYLARLPAGDTRGPEPTRSESYVTMDYGPSLIHTYEAGDDGSNLAYKGIAVRLDPGPGGVSRGSRWMIFDHDTLRAAAGWSGSGFINWNGVQFDGAHEVHPHLVGDLQWQNKGPGWAQPGSDSFIDLRLVGRDGKRYGPLPRWWAHFRGTYSYGAQTVIAYRIGDTDVLELPGYRSIEPNAAGEPPGVFTRTFQIGSRSMPLLLQVADLGVPFREQDRDESLKNVSVLVGKEREAFAAGFEPAVGELQFQSTADGKLRLAIAAGDQPLQFTLWFGQAPAEKPAAWASAVGIENPTIDLSLMTQGGPPRWPERLETRVERGAADGPFALDVLADPRDNPWLARLRTSGLDFLPDGDTLAVCTWDGDVWLVSGLKSVNGRLVWQRIASGLFQPLGLKVIDGQIYVACRDQIVILHDLNGDRETDYYENFNNDHQVTDHFHEFAMDLQTDDRGNLYYTKAARHALTALVPHHGTLLRVSPDGERTDILATGFRAPNGVCVNPDGTFFVTDQEGHWIPKNRINWVKEGRFYGNIFGYTDVVDPSNNAMEPPVCWITNAFDRSPSELVRVTSERWGPLQGSLLNLSYGYGKIFVVFTEPAGEHLQGGMCELPIPQVPTGLIRGRFHPQTGDLYTCGMFAWASNQQQEGGLYRVRYTGKPLHVPIAVHAHRHGMTLKFAAPLDAATAIDAGRYAVRIWSLERTQNYGSRHIDERPLKVTAAELHEDGCSLRLTVEDMQPTWCMSIRYDLKAKNGAPVVGQIHNTVHQLGE